MPPHLTGRLAGSIPACAGEPETAGASAPSGGVYPRVCGGTRAGRDAGMHWGGLSPRVRGNRIKRARRAADFRSIPACAGEPTGALGGAKTGKVYPRVCGGTAAAAAIRRWCKGLSPRVRGNPPWGCRGIFHSGSIPACAGEPLGLLIAPLPSYLPREWRSTACPHSTRRITPLSRAPLCPLPCGGAPP